MDNDDLYKKAEKKADEKIGFYHMLYGFIAGNAFLFIINLLFSPGNWWFYWVTIISVIVLAFKFLKSFIFNDVADRDKLIEQEMEKMKK